MNNPFVIRRLGAVLAAAAALVGASPAHAHPEVDVSLPEPNPGTGGVPVPSATPRAPGVPTASRVPTPPAAVGTKPDVPDLKDQLATGRYSGIVAMRAAQVAHAHWPNDLQRAPLEIWYIASRKPYQGGGVIYCVSPRTELPGERDWTGPQFTVELRRRDLPALQPVTVQSDLLAGSSREAFSASLANGWCVVRPGNVLAPTGWVLRTDHGKATVVFPGPVTEAR